MRHKNAINQFSVTKDNKKKKARLMIRISLTLVLLSIIVLVSYNKFILTDAKDNVKENAKVEDTNYKNDHNNNVDNKKNVQKYKEVKVLANNTLDNSGYLPYNDDPNAEDAEVVFNNTEGLLKRELTYPVRKDGKKVVYLTFDDGPSTENTQNILDTLDKYGIKATFFVTGMEIDQNDESKRLLKEIVQDGNAIGNHTYSHDYKKLYPNRTIDPQAFMNDIRKNEDSMKAVLGKDFHTRVIRFPGGYWSWDGRSNIRPILDSNGYYFINWNVLNEDAQGVPNKKAPQLLSILENYVEGLGKDADSIVVLMHDTYGKGETAKALPEVIEYFKNKGFEFKSIK